MLQISFQLIWKRQILWLSLTQIRKLEIYGLKTLLKETLITLLNILVYTDNNLNWEYQIKHVNSKIAKNTGITNILL